MAIFIRRLIEQFAYLKKMTVKIYAILRCIKQPFIYKEMSINVGYVTLVLDKKRGNTEGSKI
jgi:hypothetical protein